jgi:hypothetical protein
MDQSHHLGREAGEDIEVRMVFYIGLALHLEGNGLGETTSYACSCVFCSRLGSM